MRWKTLSYSSSSSSPSIPAAASSAEWKEGEVSPPRAPWPAQPARDSLASRHALNFTSSFNPKLAEMSKQSINMNNSYAKPRSLHSSTLPSHFISGRDISDFDAPHFQGRGSFTSHSFSGGGLNPPLNNFDGLGSGLYPPQSSGSGLYPPQSGSGLNPLSASRKVLDEELNKFYFLESGVGSAAWRR